MTLRIGSLCSGYGGLDLAVEHVTGATPAWFVEYDRDPSRILAHHWPDIPNHGDVKTTDWATVEPVDILTAGYPCQPFSHAGKRKGADDPRHLWPDVARAIGALRPGLVVLENVAGHVSLGLADVLGDLSALGYDATWGVVRAADAGAPHGRARIFIVATPDPDDGGRDRRGPHVAGGSGDRPGRVRGTTGTGANPAPDAGSGQQPRPSAAGHGLPVTPERRPVTPADADLIRREGPGAAATTIHSTPFRFATGGREGATPADATGDGWDEGRPESAGFVGGSDAAECRRSATPDTDGPGGETRGGRPRAGDVGRPQPVGDGSTHWGAYEPAIRRWQAVTGRSAPAPTEPGRTGQRLAPRFVEWMQGLSDGHVTDPAIGISRNAQLKALGNGVVPQQAALALRTLLTIAEAAA